MAYTPLSDATVKKSRLKNHLDRRPVSWGLARVIMLLLVLMTALILGREFFLFHSTSDIFYSLLNFGAASVWIIITAGVIHNGRRMRRLAILSLLVEIVLVSTVPFLSERLTETHLLDNYGGAYFYLPTLMLIVTAIWLVWSSPFRQK